MWSFAFIEDRKGNGLIETRLYAVLLGEKSITHYYGADIVMLIELGVFHPDDYIYCFSLSAWIKAVQCEEISRFLTLNAYRRSSEVIIAAPDFCPPPAPEKPPYSLREVLKGEIIAQDDESAKRSAFLEDQFKVLSAENQRLSQLSKGSGDSIATSKDSDKLSAFEEVKKEWAIRIESFQNSLKVKESEVEQVQAQLLLARKENKKLASAIKKQGDKLSFLKTGEEQWEKEKSSLMKTLKDLKKSMRLKEAQLLTLEKNHKQSKKEIKNLSSLKEEKDREVILEEQRLIGESFKVVNSAQWFIKREGQEKGPYRFSDVSDWYAKNLISGRTLVKRSSEKVFGRLEDIYEFNTRVIERYEEIGGAYESVFYIKRTDFRAPFYEVAIVEIDGQVEKAQCTSLSIGGCFIEMKDIENIKENSIFKVEIKADYLAVSIEASVIAKNIKTGRNKGVGCQFLDLEEEQVSAIEEFVSSYLDSQSIEQNSKKAA